MIFLRQTLIAELCGAGAKKVMEGMAIKMRKVAEAKNLWRRGVSEK
jgi:hypothetical protein